MTFTSEEYDKLALQAINESKDLGIGQSAFVSHHRFVVEDVAGEGSGFLLTDDDRGVPNDLSTQPRP